MKAILSLALAAATVIATVSTHSISKRSPGTHWDYGADKGGPSHWGLLDPAYVICDKGLQQSPIDIDADTLSRFVTCATKALTFDYKPLKDSVAHFNGHTVEVDWTPSATAHNNSITIGTKQYNLVQFHFHTPSEHRINGRHADAELHLVHRSPVDQSLAVIGVLLQAQAKNVPFFKYLTALQKKVHAHHGSVSHAALIENDSATSIEDAELEDEEGDELEDEEGYSDEDEEDDEFNAEAEYNAEDETDFASQDFDAEPDIDAENGNQVDINVNNLDKGLDIQNNDKRKNSQEAFLLVNNNNNGDNNQDSQDIDSASASSFPEDVVSPASAEKCKPTTTDETICTGEPPTGEEAIHIDLPLKSVDFSPLIKTVKGFTYRWEYSGSLTTPPCSEHVAWNVMHEPFPIGLEQLRALVDLQGYNARQINEDPESKRDP
ncbi:hypothetical protein EC991_004084 [Linnemannia zychae]|nr:hypothetical protein EC991_004084 [Linnemannia zychae]